MQYFPESTAVVGVSELRTQFDRILKVAATSRVYLEKRQKRVAVLVPLEKFEQMEELLERVEDAILGYTAMERERKTKLESYYTLDEAEKKVGLKK